ncbi:hypothetical protein RR42_s1382 [Cupriavidus basilensis]|uniref:Uncharacterized protein n=1 Tax=Cupriavidus basilensis TaxID=68895 RepID=A0A0C4YK64_9BURK|nr:hypothetical protein RR42_s1382 [Cupriavidus basilensis]
MPTLGAMGTMAMNISLPDALKRVVDEPVDTTDPVRSLP